MAKKRAVAKRHHVRRHRVAGIGKGLEEVAYVIIGAIAGRTVNNMLTKVNATTGKPMLDAKISAAGVTVAGVLVKKFVKGEIGAGIGLGMSAVGGLQLAQSVGVLAGIDSLASGSMVAGYLPAGASAKNSVAGYKAPAQMSMVGAIVDEC